MKEQSLEPDSAWCLYCGMPLGFVPSSEDGGFCSVECEDSWIETGGQPKEYPPEDEDDSIHEGWE